MREYTKPVKKKNTEKPVCEYCLNSSKDKTQYVWIDRGTYYALACLDCVEEYDLFISKPYFVSTRKVKDVSDKLVEKKKGRTRKN